MADTLVRQAANVLDLLEYFARRGRPAGAAEIAEELGWPRSSTFNLVGTLAARGYLYEAAPRAGHYPTPRWLAMAEAIAAAEPLPGEIQRLARALLEETGETTVIAAPAGTHATFVHVEESRRPVRFFAQVGDRVPIQASSAGRALLAQMPPDERERLYRRIDFQSFSATSPVDAETVEAELRAADARGYHQSQAEYTPDLAGVALPLPGARRLSVVVVGPVSRCLDRRAETAALVRDRLATLERD